MTVTHFEAPLAINEDDRFEVVYRIPFPQLTDYRYNTFHEGRDLTLVETSHININSETIDGENAFEFIDTYFKTHHDVEQTDEHCMYRVNLENHVLCYRDTRDNDQTGPVSIFFE